MRTRFLIAGLLVALLAGCSAVNHTLRAVSAEKAHDYDAQIAHAKKATETDPKYAPGWYWLGCGHWNKNEYDAAIAAFRRFFALNPSGVQVASAYSMLAHAYLKTGQDEAARDCAKRAVELEPNEDAYHNRLGIVLGDGLGRWDEAAASFQRAVDLAPHNATYHENLAKARKGGADKKPAPAPPPASAGAAPTLRGYLGVLVAEKDGACLVADVKAGSPAAAAGVAAGDKLASVNGSPVASKQDLMRILSRLGPGDKVALGLLRDGRRSTREIVLAPRPDGEPGSAPAPAAPAAPAPAPVAASPPASSAAAPGDTFVLVIGVNDYADPQIPRLRFAEADARAVYAFFATERRSPASADRVGFLVGKEASRLNILKAIREELVLKAVRPEDTAILYFAGHGFADARTTYLAGADTQLAMLPETAISAGTLAEYWEQVPAGRKVLVTDACHAGGIGGARGVGGVTLAPRAGEAAAAPAGSLTIAASGPSEVSTEDERLGEGVFTIALLKGLRGEADGDADGRVRADELERFLLREVPILAARAGGRQTPLVRRGAGGPTIWLTR